MAISTVKSEIIKHIGTVTSIESRCVCVEITSHSACSSCNVRMACGMSESAAKNVDVHTDKASDFSVGDTVVVGVKKSIGITAVILAYVVPIIFLVTSLIIGLSLFEQNEGLVAISSLISVAVYYVGLYLLKDKIDNKIQFSITKE